jgi:hypothetical protein
MSKRKKIRRQTMADKILHTKLKIEQHQPSFGPWDQEWEVQQPLIYIYSTMPTGLNKKTILIYHELEQYCIVTVYL